MLLGGPQHVHCSCILACIVKDCSCIASNHKFGSSYALECSRGSNEPHNLDQRMVGDRYPTSRCRTSETQGYQDKTSVLPRKRGAAGRRWKLEQDVQSPFSAQVEHSRLKLADRMMNAVRCHASFLAAVLSTHRTLSTNDSVALSGLVVHGLLGIFDRC